MGRERQSGGERKLKGKKREGRKEREVGEDGPEGQGVDGVDCVGVGVRDLESVTHFPTEPVSQRAG